MSDSCALIYKHWKHNKTNILKHQNFVFKIWLALTIPLLTSLTKSCFCKNISDKSRNITLLMLTCIFHSPDSDTASCPCRTSGKCHSNTPQTAHDTAGKSVVPKRGIFYTYTLHFFLDSHKYNIKSKEKPFKITLRSPSPGSTNISAASSCFSHLPAELSDTRSTAPLSLWIDPSGGSPLHHGTADTHTVYHSKVPAIYRSRW